MAEASTPDTPIKKSNPLFSKKVIMAVFFATLAVLMFFVSPSIEVAWTCAFLLLTIYLFAFEVVGVDVAATMVMVMLGLTTLFAPIMGLTQGLVDNDQLFMGFSSNAVISIIAVMIIGAGLDKTGIMSQVAAFILKVGGIKEKRIIAIISSTVGFISSFMQNVGAAALFLPVVSRISARSGLPLSRLLMPMGFCAILGGTMTMVGSSPLILLNDLILTSNQTLPAEQQMEAWGLFSVTPIGVALIIVGILYFALAGKYVLPTAEVREEALSMVRGKQQLQDVYGVTYDLLEVVVPKDSTLIGKQFDEIETEYKIRIVATHKSKKGGGVSIRNLDRNSEIIEWETLALLASPEDLQHFVEKYQLVVHRTIKVFEDELSPMKAGLAEIVIPPSSSLIGKSARDVWLRKAFGLSMVGIHRDGVTMREGEDIRSKPFHSGDTMIVYTTWDVLAHTEKNKKDFLVVTTEYPKEEVRPHKVIPALVFFLIALSMVLFTDIKLSVALLTGALGMILSGVLRVEEAYQAVSWKTVFLLASLIPLGLAVQTSGTAQWIAEMTLSVVGDMPIWVIQLSIAILATFFTLVMSNVGATVLLVPLAVNIAMGIGANPAVFALTVAVATSNSFLIPTHQVNALIMGPAGYRVPDFMRAGGIMTVLFLIVMMLVMGAIF
jgi:di/tricarboxylate transporter